MPEERARRGPGHLDLTQHPKGKRAGRGRFVNRHFAKIWLGQSVSQLGDAVVEVTLPVWVGILIGSPAHVAGVAAAEILPSLVLGPFAGTLADRLDPRKTMVERLFRPEDLEEVAPASPARWRSLLRKAGAR